MASLGSILMQQGLTVTDRDVYNLNHLHTVFSFIAEGYTGNKPVDEVTFIKWIMSSRVTSYLKKLSINAGFYDRALSLNGTNHKFIKLLLVLFLTEVMGRKGCEKIVISSAQKEDQEADYVITLFLEPSSSVDYTLTYDPSAHPSNTVTERLFVSRR